MAESGKKITISIFSICLAVLLLPSFALASTWKDKMLIADDVTDCSSKVNEDDNDKQHVTPANCLFLEEPIGGRPGYDLYYVQCTENPETKIQICSTFLWYSGDPTNDTNSSVRGPIQAIISKDAGKPEQGPFSLLYNYMGLIYAYMSGLIVGVAVLFVVVGGIQMSVSQGGDQFEAGKKRIIKVIVGLILWFTASLVLYTINPTFFTF